MVYVRSEHRRVVPVVVGRRFPTLEVSSRIFHSNNYYPVWQGGAIYTATAVDVLKIYQAGCLGPLPLPYRSGLSL